MLLGVVLVVLAAVALVAGSALLGDGLAGLSGSLPARQVRAVVIALSGALATTVVAVARNQTAMGSGVPFGAAMFVVASGFGAGALLGRRRMVVDDPILYAAPAAGVVLAALSVSSDRAFSRGAGVLLAIVFVPYLLWVLLEPVRTHAAVPDELAHDEAREHALDEGTSATDVRAGVSEEPTAGGTADVPVGKTADVRVGKTADVRVERPAGGRPSSGRAVAGGRALGGAVLVVGAAFALVEGTVRVGVRAHLAPGFAGAALAGSLVALPFALLVVFPRSTRQD